MIRSAGYDKRRARDFLAISGFDAYVAASPENVFYISGYPIRHSSANSAPFVLLNQYPTFCVIDSDGEASLIAWMAAVRDREFDLKETLPVVNKGEALETILSTVKSSSKSNATIGVDERFPAFAYSALNKEPSLRVAVDESPMLNLRLQKSAEEKRRILAGTEICEKTMESLRGWLKEGVSDLEIIAKSKRVMLDLGADTWDHTTIPIGDSNPEIPNGRQAESGDIVGLDLGAIVSGYASDTHRKFAIGDVAPASVDMQTKLAEFVAKCSQRLRPGEKFSEIYNYVSALYEEAGVTFVFPNVGHSIGIQTEEANISYDSDLEVKDDMAVNIELYGASEDGHFMGLEDTFFIEGGVATMITKLPQEIIVV